MGYCIEATHIHLSIEGSKINSAIESFADLIGDGTTNYSWVSGRELRETLNRQGEWSNGRVLVELLGMFRWGADVVTNEHGGETRVEMWGFTGEKLGDDELLFEMLAPHITAGDEIEFRGEDGCVWKWSFDGAGMRELTGTIVWE